MPAKPIVNIFAPKSSRVVRVLLENPEKRWTTRELAKEANIYRGLSYRVIKTLEKLIIVVRDENNRIKLTNPDGLLDRWANAYDFRINKFVYYFLDKPSVYERAKKLFSKVKDIEYAVTGPFGCDIVTKHLRPTNIHIYVKSEKDIKKWAKKVGLGVSESGGNIIFVVPYDEGVFYHSRESKDRRIGVPIKAVSDIQLYVDLFNYPARGREGAEQLRKTCIKFKA